MEQTAFTEFGIIIGLSAFFAIIVSRFKQPSIIGYVLAGLAVGLIPNLHPSETQLELLSKIGITLLLFILGLELNFDEIKHLGKSAIIAGFAQIGVTAGLGFLLAKLLGFSQTASMYTAIGLTFSSTIVIVKLFSQKRQIDTLFGRISVGLLLVQDITAIFVLIALSAINKTDAGMSLSLFLDLGKTLGKGIVVVAIIFIFVKYVFNHLLNSIRNEKEVLFLTVIAWPLLIAILMEMKFLGFTAEIGGLVAGIALSSRFEHLQIESWLKPLRDFFLTLFFVSLGLHIKIDSFAEIIIPAVALSLFAVLLKPLITMFVMGLVGYSKKVSFYVGISMGQVSEFSLILLGTGLSLKHVTSNELATFAIVGGITMFISSYAIYYNDTLYSKLQKYLGIFEFGKPKNDQEEIKHKAEVILFGCHRMGSNFLDMLPSLQKDILVVDYDPKTITYLRQIGYQAVFGDMEDEKLYDQLDLESSKIIISTIPSFKENKKLLEYLNLLDSKPMAIVAANQDDSVKELYDAGADFVVYPHLLGSELLAKVVKKGILTKELVKIRTQHLEKVNNWEIINR